MADAASAVVVTTDMTIPAVSAAPAVPETVEVKVGDKTLKVSKDTAAVITALQQTASDAAAAAQVLEAKLKAVPAATTTTAAAPAEENYDRLFQDPKGFVTDLAEKIKNDLRAEYTQTTLQRDFWTAFYDTHKDLKKHDFYVKAVLDREIAVYGKLKVPEVIEKLGTTVKTELLALGGNKGGTLTKPAAEGGTERLVVESKEGSEDSLTEPVGSLTSLIKQRRAARRAKPQAQVTT
jgi:hypothetical protein